MSTEDDGFIGRWSRRKTETRDGGLQKTNLEPAAPVRGRMITDPLPVSEPPSEQDNLDDKDDEAVAAPIETASDVPKDTEEAESSSPDVAELEKIDIESLGYDADFTPFMKPGVPDALRQRALRRLWNSNPILANVDGLNDYDEDFSDAALVVENLQSAWKVGQGYLTDEEVAERDAERLEEDLAAQSAALTFDRQPDLRGEQVSLRPLRPDDFDELYTVASDPRIWEQHPARNRYEPEEFRSYFDEAIQSGGALVILDAGTQEMIGATRYHDYDPERSSVEIGWTFLRRDHWGGATNSNLKVLMLDHAFQTVEHVEFLIAEDNVRSQKSVEKIGARQTAQRTKPDGTEMLVFTVNRSAS